MIELFSVTDKCKTIQIIEAQRIYLLSFEPAVANVELPLTRDVMPLMRVGAGVEFDRS